MLLNAKQMLADGNGSKISKIPKSDPRRCCFNPSGEPARYLVLRYGNDRFGMREGQMPQSKKVRRSNKPQIEFKDEQSEIRKLFEEECRKHGIQSAMPPL
jgi:hypothetical protein